MEFGNGALGFLHWSDLDPGRTALIDDRHVIDYASLRIRVLALAGSLREAGVAPGDVVAVACDRSIESVIGILAVISTGAAYLPLDLSYPSARLVDMVADAQPRVAVAVPDAPLDMLRSLGLTVVETTAVAGTETPAVPVAADDDAPAYVLFTSGSTGRPKGVVIPRRALDRMIDWHRSHPRLGQPAKLLQFCAFGFDPSVRDIFVTLALGGALVIAAESDRRDPFRLLARMREQRVERVSLPYVALRAIAQAHAEGGAVPDRLRDVVTGGEALAVTPAIRHLFSALPDATLYNEYGPTESCVFVTSHALAGDPLQWPERPEMGRALSYAHLHVVDENLQPVPDGIEGELLIGGESLAIGYINQPGLTAERFVRIRPPGGSLERVYRSGDRVRRQDGGSLVFLGRADEQVKIAGHRLELGEVETVLVAHAAVRDVAVVAPASAEGRRLVAYILLTTNVPSVHDVRADLEQHLAANLPVFSRPQLLIFRDALPLTPGGKVDRRQLETESVDPLGTSPVRPGATVEDHVLGLWRQLLANPSLDIDDNVFDHGADSLLAMVFVARIRAVAGHGLSTAAIYEFPTSRQQSQAMAAIESKQAVAEAPASGQAALPMEVPLSDAQMEKWFASQFGEMASLAFNESALLYLDGALDTTAFKRALAMVWQRHEVLHFSIAADGNSQRFNADASLPLGELDYSSPADQSTVRLDAFCAQQVGHAFDLTVAPLVRFTLIRLGDRRHALHAISHHLVMDGWSLALLVDELGHCYNACVAGRATDLAAAGSFRRYLINERERRAAGGTATSLAYWKQIYATPPTALRLPADRPALPEPDYAAGIERRALSPALTGALRNQARRCGVSLYSLLLSAFGVVVGRLSGQHDFAIAVPFAGLALGGSQALMGDGVSALPVRMRVEAEMPFGELARHTHAALLGAADHQDTTMTGIQRMLGLRASGGEAALTGVMFSLLPKASAAVFEGLAHHVRECPRAALDWDLYGNFTDTGETLTFDLHYATARYDGSTVRRWAGFYETVLAAAAGMDDGAMAGTAVDDIDLLDMATRREVLQTWNATNRDYDRGQGLTTLIEAQMRQTPGRIAAECNGQHLDYAALECSTRTLAQALRRRGIGRGDMVGICVPRSLDMLVAVLGVLRSGAAYVPLDPEFPDSRLRHMAEHSRLRHVLMSELDLVPTVIASSRELLAVADLCAEPVDELPLPEVRGDDVAYVLFTSGSTGEPKGVRILHRNLVNFLLSMRDEPGFGPDDVLCAVTTLSFDIAGLELYLPLIAGGRLVIATETLHREPSALFELLERTHCTVLQTTPSLLQLLQGIGREDVVRQLRLFVGGEALPLPLAHAMAGQCREFWNLYGPTETTIWSTTARIRPDVQTIPLGKPIANTRIYVLDARGRPVPPGAIGEIWIGGDGVSDGYLFRPELTAERFVADPFVGGDARMYRTGDLGNQREGVLYFHGRADNQIKIRGYRIEPGDIEAAAGNDPAVHECVAVARRFGDNDLRLVLYVVADGHDPEFAERLRELLRRRLPAYMRPQHIELLGALPKTPNGKIDRNALPPPAVSKTADLPSMSATDSIRPPAFDDPRQAYLASVWCELVGVKTVRGNDNFFDIGGHSLLAVEFTTRVHRETGVRLSLLAVATSTLASLATELRVESELSEDATGGTSASLRERLRRLWRSN